ncbi:MAG: FGGY-family carbohydrate kinase, partial [Bdellovibrionaceae bacterium]|nr:FGGY-family carbohydrate kinase [Pseudobdellovibrionaceae bacterium]
PNARGIICGLTRGTTKAHIARATLEAMALQNVEILQAMQKDMGGKLRSVRVDGGAAANNLLMQMQADYLGVSVERPAFLETTALGAAFLAGLGAEIWSSPGEIRKIWRPERIFHPQLSPKGRRLRLENWSSAITRAKL